MQRAITGYHWDEAGDPVAELACGHGQHVRHQPPMMSRLECVRCDRFERPDGLVAYQRTAEFTEATMPAGLRRDHTTKAGVWAEIRVLEGRLRYRVPSLGREFALDAATPGVVLPEVAHHVEPDGAVRFYVEFSRRS
jgi:tellurite methyltransferase